MTDPIYRIHSKLTGMKRKISALFRKYPILGIVLKKKKESSITTGFFNKTSRPIKTDDMISLENTPRPIKMVVFTT